MVRRITTIIITLLILVGGATLCVLRWNAWFGNPDEPTFTGDTLTCTLPTFGYDSVPGFVSTDQGWQDINEPDTLRMIILGDGHNSITRGQWDTLAMRHPDVDCYAQVGDLLERGYFYYAQMLYKEIDSTLFCRIPILATPGNHEYRKGLVRRLPQAWYEMFPNPSNGPQRFLGTSYYVDFPTLRFIVIDTNGLQRLSDYTIVNTWLAGVLRSAGSRFTVVMMHHPVWSCGAGRQNIPIWLSFFRVLKRADIVFSGHDHNYARRMPKHNNNSIYIGLNSARKFYMNKVSARDKRICSGRQLYELLSIYGDTLRAQTYLMDSGELYDEITLIGHGAARQIVDTTATMPEIIDLPAKYAKRNDIKVRRFRNRRSQRLASSVCDNK